jgi:MFS transporter, SET family, sugar efflux transporter
VYFALAAGATHTWQLAAGQLLNAASIAAIQGLGVTYVQDLLPSQPGRMSTLYSNAFPAGAILAGPVVGAAAHIGYRGAYAVAACLAAGGFALLLVNPPARARRMVDAGRRSP